MNVHEILSKIQFELKAPKNQRNTFGNYNYRSCEDILEAVKPLLGGAVVIISDEVVMIGSRYYVKATSTITYEGASLFCSAYAREQETKKGMDEAQITGSASSYARKYSLNGLLAINDEKDPDHENTGDNQSKQNKSKTLAAPSTTEHKNPDIITDPERVRLRAIATTAKYPNDLMKKIVISCGYKSSTEILKKHYQAICDFIETTPVEHVEKNLEMLEKFIKEI